MAMLEKILAPGENRQLTPSHWQPTHMILADIMFETHQ